MKFSIILYVVFLSFYFGHGESAKILFVNSARAYSHQKPFQLICEELAARGHDVHVISTVPVSKEVRKNLTVYDISDAFTETQEEIRNILSSAQRKLLFQKPNIFTTIFLKDSVNLILVKTWCRMYLKHKNIERLLSTNQHFDLVIVEWLFPVLAAFGAYYECPTIGIASMSLQSIGLDSAGNPSHPVLYPDPNLPVKRDLSFMDRITVSIYSIVLRINFYWKFVPEHDKVIKKRFGSKMPYLGDIINNVSLLLMNRHSIFHGPVPLLPNVVEFGGIKYPKDNKTINKDIKQFLDSSSEGVIFFSLGSSFDTQLVTPEVLKILQDTFRSLPYKVLWKWHNSTMENKPSNVMVRTWVPQTAILDHPNVKLFVFQGGLQSSEEAIAAHKPIIGLPLHSDQVGNIDACVKFGIGEVLDMDTVTLEELSQTIKVIMQNNTRYVKKAKELHRLMMDQPTDGLEKAIWWIEYVIRNKGAKHLRSKSVDMPFWQYYFLDVAAMALAILIFIISALFWTTKCLFRVWNAFGSKIKVE